MLLKLLASIFGKNFPLNRKPLSYILGCEIRIKNSCKVNLFCAKLGKKIEEVVWNLTTQIYSSTLTKSCLSVIGMTNTTVVMANAPMVVGAVHFGESPVVMTCPVCKNHVSTTTSRSTGGLAWILCLAMFFLG